MARRLTIRDFLEKAKSVHGEKYDYSKVPYLYESDKITIFCKKHQIEFQQSVHKHLAGQGCRKCASEANADRSRTSISEFIQKAKAIHGDKYNYDGIEYKNNNSNIKINCPIHGEQHYRPVKFGGLADNNADNRFEEVKKRDEIKKEYARKNGIPLLIIKQDKTGKILEIIKEFFKVNK